MDFSRRIYEPEWMDTEEVTAEDFARCLADLATVNILTLAHRPTLSWLARVTRDLPQGTPLSFLDVGSGYGDLLRAVARFAARKGFVARLAGMDLNPLSTRAAIAATPPQLPITFETSDAFAIPAEPRYDFILCSLFTHHLDDEQIVAYLRWADARARLGWFVNDLHRSRIAYYAFAGATALLPFHRFVRHDGMLSIRRSFRRADWQQLVAAAGIRAEIDWYFPFRYCVSARHAPVVGTHAEAA